MSRNNNLSLDNLNISSQLQTRRLFVCSEKDRGGEVLPCLIKLEGLKVTTGEVEILLQPYTL
eukprot:760476-Hanusia_phi.AAC.2